MTLTLSENIRAFRKQRKLTQEKLAEALGVTVGAVYKWEAGLSVPELDLIVEMADFFDVSIDALLGYQMKDNRLEPTLDRLLAYCRTMDPAALTEAEKLLGRYPHSFRAVFECAKVYLAFGSGSRDPQLLDRARELLELSRILLPQNDDPRISDAAICGALSSAWSLLGEQEKSLELLKKNNALGQFSGEIGSSLALDLGRPEEAAPYLSEALLRGASMLLTAVLGYVFLFRSRADWESAQAIAAWGLTLLGGLKTGGGTDSLDKVYAELLVLQAYAQMKAGREEEARASLREVASLALRFDSDPDFSLRAMRFAEGMDQAVVFDAMGTTAAASVERLLGLLDDPPLEKLWKEVSGNGA